MHPRVEFKLDVLSSGSTRKHRKVERLLGCQVVRANDTSSRRAAYAVVLTYSYDFGTYAHQCGRISQRPASCGQRDVDDDRHAAPARQLSARQSVSPSQQVPATATAPFYLLKCIWAFSVEERLSVAESHLALPHWHFSNVRTVSMNCLKSLARDALVPLRQAPLTSRRGARRDASVRRHLTLETRAACDGSCMPFPCSPSPSATGILRQSGVHSGARTGVAVASEPPSLPPPPPPPSLPSKGSLVSFLLLRGFDINLCKIYEE